MNGRGGNVIKYSFEKFVNVRKEGRKNMFSFSDGTHWSMLNGGKTPLERERLKTKDGEGKTQ